MDKITKINKKNKLTLKELTKEDGFIWFFLTISFLVLMIGSSCNFKAISSNHGMMPVYNCYGGCSDSEHIEFSNKTKINNFYLVDILKIKQFYFSVGDLFLWIGFCGIFFSSCVLIYKNIKRLKKLKNEKIKSNNRQD
jgi:hypothetical protein